MKNKRVSIITKAGIIAALYVILTYVSSLLGISSGVIQCRLSEALTVLPYITFSAVPGLFVGCLISNILFSGVVLDIVFGSIATLIGAVITYLLRNKSVYFAPIGPIVANTVIVPFVLRYAYGMQDAFWFMALTVFIGEVISCGVFGLMLYFSSKNRLSGLLK